MNPHTAAKELYDLGFNVVLICGEKKPCGKWSWQTRNEFDGVDWRRVTAVAITGWWFAEPGYAVVAFDVDDTEAGFKILEEVFGEDWRTRLCGQSWSLCALTGPRPKGKVDCCSGKCVNTETGEVLEEPERGLAIVVRVAVTPKQKEALAKRGNVVGTPIELRINGYQLLAGRHPSCLDYQPVRWVEGRWVPVDTLGQGEIVTYEELMNLIRALTQKPAEGKEDEEEEEGGGRGQGPPPPTRELSEEDLTALVELAKEVWPVETPDGGRFHDYWLYSTLSLMRRAGVKREVAEEYVRRVLNWSAENGLDRETDVKHHMGLVDEVYSDRVKLFGVRKFEEVVQSIAEVARWQPEKVRAVVNTVLSLIGVSRGKPLCIPVVRKNRRVVEIVCNDMHAGIAHIKFQEGKDGEETVVKTLVAYHIERLEKYVDKITQRTYYTAVLRNVKTGQRVELKMTDEKRFFDVLEKNRAMYTNANYFALLNTYTYTEDIIISGFVCGDGIECGVRDYWNLGYAQQADPQKAKEAIEELMRLLKEYAPSDRWLNTVLYALALGAFTNFSLTRKLHSVRTKMVVLTGKQATGKSTTLDILAAMFSVRRENAATFATRARVGRMVDLYGGVTGIILLDEVKLLTAEDLMEVLKAYVTQLTAWVTAHGERWPAFSGVVMAANQFDVVDPALADKIVIIEYGDAPPREKHAEFAERLNALRPKLAEFGRYYLQYAAQNWAEVKSVILGERWEERALEYFNAVLKSLGVEPPEIEVEAVDVAGGYDVIAKFREALDQFLDEKLSRVPLESRKTSMATIIEYIASQGLALTYLAYGENKNGKYIVIKDAFARKYMHMSIRELCEALGGQLVYTQRKHSQCYVDTVELYRLLEEE